MEKELLKEKGFNLDAYGVVGSDEECKMAMDSALITTANSGIPVEVLTSFNERAIKVLTEKRAATEIFAERKFSDRAELIKKFRMIEATGYTQPYSDYSDNGKSGVNYNFIPRENYLFETVIKYGDLEQEMVAKAKANLLADLQASAALNIAIDFNRFYMKGVEGLENYGILNQPNLPVAITAANGAGGTPQWSTKTGAEIYKDIVAMMSDMASRTGGLVDMTTRYKLVIGASVYPYLAQQNSLGTETVLGMIKRSFPNLEVVVAPEYDDDYVPGTGGVQKVAQLIAVEVDGIPTGELGFSEKLSAGRVVPFLSHHAQKFMAGTYGAVIYRPVFVTTMVSI